MERRRSSRRKGFAHGSWWNARKREKTWLSSCVQDIPDEGGRGEDAKEGRIGARQRRGMRIGARACASVEMDHGRVRRRRVAGTGDDCEGAPSGLIPCHDIHTFGMRYPLDVAFISRDGCVLEVHRNVATMKRISHKEASLVAERFSRDGDWLKKGDVIHIGSAKRD